MYVLLCNQIIEYGSINIIYFLTYLTFLLCSFTQFNEIQQMNLQFCSLNRKPKSQAPAVPESRNVLRFNHLIAGSNVPARMAIISKVITSPELALINVSQVPRNEARRADHPRQLLNSISIPISLKPRYILPLNIVPELP